MNAVIYARYSSHAQTEQSIEGQLRDNYAWARQQDITVVGEYIDRALSGTKDARPDFQRMIEDAAKRQFQLVIVWKLDRFARNRYDSAIYKARLKKYGVRVVSVKENITDSPEGIILEGLLEAMAEYYSANLSQNVKRGMRETIAKGRFCGGHVPYGYKLVDGKLIEDPKTAPVIRYVFEQYASGVPKREIIKVLNAHGVRSCFGKPLSYTSFSASLPNTVYIGQFKFKGEIIPDVAQPLIDPATFQAVQDRLKATARAPAASKALVEYHLQGKAFCGHCGAPLVGECGRSRNGSTYNYYACAKKKKHHTCDKKNERKDFLEWYVVEQTLLYVLTPIRARQIAKAVVEEYNKEFSDTRIDSYQETLDQLDRELDKLVDALTTVPKVAHQKIYNRMESIDAQKQALEAELARLQIAATLRLTEQEVLSWLHQFQQGDPTDPAFRQKVIDTFINAIYAYNDHIVIFYNIRTPTNPTKLPTLNPDGSNLNDLSVPDNFKSEPNYIFVNGTFGCIFYRSREAE